MNGAKPDRFSRGIRRQVLSKLNYTLEQVAVGEGFGDRLLPESRRRLKIPIREYLAGVLHGLPGTSVQRLADRTPTAWAALRLSPLAQAQTLPF